MKFQSVYLLLLVVFLPNNIMSQGTDVPPPPPCSKSIGSELTIPLIKGLSLEMGPFTAHNREVNLNDLGCIKESIYLLAPLRVDLGIGIRTGTPRVGFSGNSEYTFFEFGGHFYKYNDNWFCPCYFTTGPIIAIGKKWILRLKLGFVFYVFDL
jgi:hypothetical protein